MNTTIEQAIAAWLGSLATFAGITIHPGQSDEEIPNDREMIYVVCNNTESPAPSLYSASIQIVISTPELIEGNLVVHKSIVSSLRTALREADGVAAFFPDSTRCVGAALNKWDDAQDSGRWTTAADITLGIIDTLAII
jgi:hypothetical protein